MTPVQVRLQSLRLKGSKSSTISSVVVPLNVKASNNPDDIDVGEELTGNKIKKEDLLKTLNLFFRRQPIKKLSEDHGLDNKLFAQAFVSFRTYCLESSVLSPELHVVLSDILQGHGHVDDLFSYFMKHARLVFPHLECIDELRKISDSRSPAQLYPEARMSERKIIFHCGPTNSGKTYHALKRFIEAESGVYCGPLKLLAVEVNAKCNEAGTPCDLVTGEERTYAKSDQDPAKHVASTVEMVSTSSTCEVAVIDEIQMLRDPQRGWAWTRALLGIPAKEIHLCGEEAAADVMRELLMPIGEELEIRRYKRLTKLTIEDRALETLDNVQPGDCIVCFNKNDIYQVTMYLEKQGHDVAVIYGGLPPTTKLAQAKRFNDPNDKCKILVATDAIGMGLNLSIKRIVFYSIIKTTVNSKGEKDMELISVSQALQIAGRAGRYKTDYENGSVTTFRAQDLDELKNVLSQPVDPIAAAGILPTADQMELFAYHLPNASLSNLIDIFVSLCQIDSTYYFMCNVEEFKMLADMIQHIALPLRTRYVFCCSPINKNSPFVCTMFVKYARNFSLNEPMTMEWLCRNIGWPFKQPGKIGELMFLEQVFDVLDVYLWLSYRFPDMFPDQALVRDMQKEIDLLIYSGVVRITRLLRDLSQDKVIHPKAKEKVRNVEAFLDEPSDKHSGAKSTKITKSSALKALDKLLEDHVVKNVNSEKIGRSETRTLKKTRKSISQQVLGGAEATPDSLADKLVSTGVITPKMLELLKDEWKKTSADLRSEKKKK
ncbi:ATP-dependent RNA helicase SUPV3L1, mitochondrial [Halotydeus destructor]|nr:ATP-dependent RNA helicase SUPV3L1, mitochondrial [Halotydeus destructor]